MNHPLDGARLKVVRAQQHLDSLRIEIRRYLEHNKPDGWAEKYSDTGIVMHPSKRPEIPLELSTIIGDCVTNARAALDYIVWQLATRHFDPPLTAKDRSWVSWPIYETDTIERYVSKINGFANRKMPADAIREIKQTHHQNAGYESLWWLNTLANEDKHRMPLLTVNRGRDTLVMDLLGLRRPDVGSVAIKAHVETGSGTRAPFHVDMYVQPTAYVAWQDVAMPREPVDRTLEQIIETVANIVPRFDAFF